MVHSTWPGVPRRRATHASWTAVASALPFGTLPPRVHQRVVSARSVGARHGSRQHPEGEHVAFQDRRGSRPCSALPRLRFSRHSSSHDAVRSAAWVEPAHAHARTRSTAFRAPCAAAHGAATLGALVRVRSPYAGSAGPEILACPAARARRDQPRTMAGSRKLVEYRATGSRGVAAAGRGCRGVERAEVRATVAALDPDRKVCR